MAHFNLENQMSSVLQMNAPPTKGPQIKWQRKINEPESNLSASTTNTSKTPIKNANRSGNKQTSSASKTPKSGGKSRAHGQCKTPLTPQCGDRFIPNRAATQFEIGYYKIMKENNSAENKMLSPSQQEYQKVMSENLNGDALNSKIISYMPKAPTAPEGYQNNLKILYSSCKTGSSKKLTRHIPQVPERILDAPEILDDYYLNLLDWSVNNHLAVSLGSHLYLWNAGSGDILQLTQMENPENYIGSVAWVKEGNYLAVGTSTGDVQLWDVAAEKRLRTMSGHTSRVGSLSWNSYILSSGSRSGRIHHHDVRVPQHLVGTLSGHTQEVCGLKWSPDGSYLASGGNDNLLNIWAAIAGQSITQTQPLYTFTHHQAAVKALAWCPWQPRLLASGGGTADRHIHFWNCSAGSCIESVDTKSQVCSILWSNEYKELISSHGFAQNQLIIWKYPSLTKIAELTGHTARVLHMAMSPDGSMVVSAGADETLRLWKCFAISDQKKKAQKRTTKSTSAIRFSIR